MSLLVPTEADKGRVITILCPGVDHADVEGHIISNGIDIEIQRKPSLAMMSPKSAMMSPKSAAESPTQEVLLMPYLGHQFNGTGSSADSGFRKSGLIPPTTLVSMLGP